jgi:phosphatidyl-myo-inositol alpha-mannosyltransferase
MMKIGFVLDDTLDKPDGVQQYVLTMGAWLTAQGHEVHYLAGQSKRQDVGKVHSLSKNIRVKFNGNHLSIPLPANNRVIKELLAREQYDVLHVQMPYSPMLAHKVVRFAPKTTAVIGTFHILPQTRFVRVATHALGGWLHSSLRRFDQVFAVSPAAQVFASTAFRLSDVQVLPNVVALRTFQKAKPFPRYNDAIPTIMFLGRLVPRKGCAVFLDALALLKKNNPDLPFRAVVCGKGPLEAELKSRAKRLGIEGMVEFTGFIDEADKPGYVASADIMAFPSNGGESFGIVLIEAMAAGRPVVLAGDNPGYRSVLQNRPDQLFEPRDNRLLAQKLQILLSDPSFRTAAVAWQLQHVGQFDIDTVGPQLVAAYSQTSSHRKQKQQSP